MSRYLSQVLRNAFEAHPARESDPALALYSAQETLSEEISTLEKCALVDVYGEVDPHNLTFEFEPECLENLQDAYLAICTELRHARSPYVTVGLSTMRSRVLNALDPFNAP